jgi:hypothetical protein
VSAASIIRELVDDGFGTLRSDYSGRGMFGARCMGIVTDDPQGLIEEAASRGLRGAKVDGMGRDSIVYWERVSAEESEQ